MQLILDLRQNQFQTFSVELCLLRLLRYVRELHDLIVLLDLLQEDLLSLLDTQMFVVLFLVALEYFLLELLYDRIVLLLLLLLLLLILLLIQIRIIVFLLRALLITTLCALILTIRSDWPIACV